MCSISLATREMQIKTILSLISPQSKWLWLRKPLTNVGMDVGKGESLLSVGGGLLTGAASMEINMEESHKLKVDLHMIQLYYSPCLCSEDAASYAKVKNTK